MKRAEEIMRDGYGTLVTFLVLALLLFHSPYSKAQSFEDLAGMITMPRNNNRYIYAKHLFELTFDKGLSKPRPEGLAAIRNILKANLLDANVAVVSKLVWYSNKGAHFESDLVEAVVNVFEATNDRTLLDYCARFFAGQIEPLVDSSANGTRFSGKLLKTVAEIMESTNDWSLIDNSVRFLVRQISMSNSRLDKNVFQEIRQLLGNYRRDGYRFVRIRPICAPSVGGAPGSVASVAAKPII